MKAVSFGGGRLLADVFPRKELIDCLVTTFVLALHTMSREIHATGLRVARLRSNGPNLRGASSTSNFCRLGQIIGMSTRSGGQEHTQWFAPVSKVLPVLIFHVSLVTVFVLAAWRS